MLTAPTKIHAVYVLTDNKRKPQITKVIRRNLRVSNYARTKWLSLIMYKVLCNRHEKHTFIDFIFRSEYFTMDHLSLMSSRNQSHQNHQNQQLFFQHDHDTTFLQLHSYKTSYLLPQIQRIFVVFRLY